MLDLYTQQVSAALKVKAVSIWQQFLSRDSRGWYFEEQAGEGKGRIKRVFQHRAVIEKSKRGKGVE